MTRADPPFEPPPRSDRERIEDARTALIRWRHYDIPGSLADLHEALHDGDQP